MNTKTKLTSVVVLSLALLGLAACATSGDKSTKSTGKQTTITLATDADTKPFTYSDNGQTTGYDIAVAKAVFKSLPDYQLKIEVVDFDGVISGMDTGRYQMAANDIGWSKERDDKYYFSSPLSKSNNAVASKNAVASFDDLQGKSTEALASANYTKVMTDYNDTVTNKIDIKYVDASYPLGSRLADVESGKIDFLLYDAISLKNIIKSQGLALKVSDVKTGSESGKEGEEFFIFQKNEEGQALQKKVNQALKKLEADGTLKKLSQEFFGGDFVPSADAFK